MNRRTALATAAAATMTLLSGFVAVGAHTGALGIGGAPAPVVAQTATVATPVTAVTDVQTPAVSGPSTSGTKATHTPAPQRAYESQGRESDD